LPKEGDKTPVLSLSLSLSLSLFVKERPGKGGGPAAGREPPPPSGARRDRRPLRDADERRPAEERGQVEGHAEGAPGEGWAVRADALQGRDAGVEGALGPGRRGVIFILKGNTVRLTYLPPLVIGTPFLMTLFPSHTQVLKLKELGFFQ
jgi:hypothetical protein